MSAAGRRQRRRAWGWHRLTDSWARRIVAGAGITADDLVLDLGAGTGALTRPLLATGARVVAVELHPGRAARVRRLAGRLTVVERDARDVPLPHGPFRVVSNLPFSGSTPIVRHLLTDGRHLRSADVVVQRGLGIAFAAGTAPGARAWRGRYDMELVRVPASAFVPPPGVETVVLRIRPR